MRGRGSSVASNPVLIGAATLLVVIVAVFLAYNANNGLPFVPTYQLKVETPSGANLVPGNEVRIGGARVGAVSAIGVKTRPNGTNYAVLTLKLDKSIEPLPVDSTVLIRPKSVLGLKYVEITRGRAARGFIDGATVPLKNSSPVQVEIDEVTNTFDKPTRDAMRQNLDGFGDALAGRGSSLNEAIGAFRPLLRNVLPVLRTLRDPQTGLARFIGATGRFTASLAPVATEQADLFVNLDRTFGALAQVARPYIQQSIAEGPATLDESIRSFPIQRPFLVNTEGLMRELRPGVRALRTAAPTLADALRIGRPTLLRTVGLDARLERVLTALQGFAQDPLVPRGVGDLTQGVATLRPTLEFIAPAQTQCNYVSDFFRNIASLLSEGDSQGTWQRFIQIVTPAGPNNEGGPSSAPANGPVAPNYLHSNPYPNTAAPGEPKECEAGHEPYTANKQQIGNVPGTQSDTTDGVQ
jgi:virulence factor Mce-like protein